MPGHFSSIGIPTSKEEFDSVILAAKENSGIIKCKQGHYRHWSSEQGAELWMQEDESNNIVWVTPFFRSKSEMVVTIEEEITNSDTSGSIYCWADKGAYPLVFELVDYGTYEPFELPMNRPIQLCAFAEELYLYGSEKEFSLSNGNFSYESVIPGNMLSVDIGHKYSSTKTMALISGHILEANEIINPLTNKSFYWIRVKTYGGKYDIVADPKLITSAVKVNGLIQVVCSLYGRILSPKIEENPSAQPKVNKNQSPFKGLKRIFGF